MNTSSALSLNAPGLLPRISDHTVEWKIDNRPIAYEDAVQEMERMATAIQEGKARERVWLLEHEPLYTAGTSAKLEDLVEADRFPVFKTGRGGQYTYHGPGQRICYVMLDLARREKDVRKFVKSLEQWVINTLAHFQISGELRDGRVGVWVRRPDKAPIAEGQTAEDKIAAIGVRVRKWVTFHGVSLNIEPELDHYSGIVPCGIAGHGVTSLVDLGIPVTHAEVDVVLRAEFEKLFGPTLSI